MDQTTPPGGRKTAESKYFWCGSFDMSLRLLSGFEISLAWQVFHNSLPPWRRIRIGDGLIPCCDRNPYAVELPDFGVFGGSIFVVNLGPDIYPNAAENGKYYRRFGRYDQIFIHELTHVWQYYQGYWVILRSAYANKLGAGYKYAPGAPWDSYNVEQQADIVADWYVAHMSSSDIRFAYIERIVRPGIGSGLITKMPAKLLSQIKS
jgi:hypothetical protein